MADTETSDVQLVSIRPGVGCTRPVAAVGPLTVQRTAIVDVVASVDKTKRRLSELSRTSRAICNVVGGGEGGGFYFIYEKPPQMRRFLCNLFYSAFASATSSGASSGASASFG